MISDHLIASGAEEHGGGRGRLRGLVHGAVDFLQERPASFSGRSVRGEPGGHSRKHSHGAAPVFNVHAAAGVAGAGTAAGPGGNRRQHPYQGRYVGGQAGGMGHAPTHDAPREPNYDSQSPSDTPAASPTSTLDSYCGGGCVNGEHMSHWTASPAVQGMARGGGHGHEGGALGAGLLREAGRGRYEAGLGRYEGVQLPQRHHGRTVTSDDPWQPPR